MEVFVFQDQRKNKVEVVAPSKSQARKRLRSMFGDPTARFEFIESRPAPEKIFLSLPGLKQKEFRPIQPLKVAKYAELNKPCPCGSGLKFKKCCSYYNRVPDSSRPWETRAGVKDAGREEAAVHDMGGSPGEGHRDGIEVGENQGS